MRAALVLALSVLCLCAPAARGQSVTIRGADPERYSLKLRWTERGAGILTGRQGIEFVNRGPAALDRVWLRLWANGPDRCRPRRIRVRIARPATPGRRRCTALEVQLAEPVAPGAAGSISIRFRVRARPDVDRFGKIGSTTLLGNVVPLLAVEDERGLHLDPYSALGESFYSLSARWDATLRLPAGLRAATTGGVRSERVTRRSRLLTVRSYQARDFALAIGRLRAKTARVAGVRVRVLYAPRVQEVRASLRAARRSVRALSKRLGRLDAGQLDVVLLRGALSDGLFAGMEYPELVFSLPLPDVVAHEVAHQWWYGLVGNDQFSAPWLDESFAQYSHERLYPGLNLCRPGRPYELVAPRRRRIPLDSTMAVFERRSVFALGEIVYLGGSCALQTLERGIGRKRMTAVLQLLQLRNRHGVMAGTDVVAAIGEVAAGFNVARWLRVARLSRL